MPHITLNRDGPIARLTIDRPEKRNALALDTVAELVEAVRALDADASVRVVVLGGAGDRAFASGADLDEIAGLAGHPDRAVAYDGKLDALYDTLAESRLPIIARIQAAAIGGGCLLALACDLRVASPAATFGVPAGRIGLMLSPREHALLVQAVGASRAKLLLYSARRLSAEEALRAGLIDLVVPDASVEALDAGIERLATDIAQCAPHSIGVAKQFVHALAYGGSSDAESPDATLREAYERIYASEDLREGLAAFKARRAPAFKGR